MYDFNSITLEKEKEVTVKFKEHGTGVAMGKFTNGDIATWADLMKSNLWSERAIKNKMLEIARIINTNCNDELLGDTDVAFTYNTELDETVKFTYLDMYIFLRAALRYRRSTNEYKEKKAKVTELTKFIENNKSAEEKLAEAKAQLEKLTASL